MEEMKLKEHEYGYLTVDPLPTQDYLATYYQKVFTQHFNPQETVLDYTEQEYHVRKMHAELFLTSVQLQLQGKETPRLLEIGCGDAFCLAAAKDKHWVIQGVDFTVRRAQKFHPDIVSDIYVGDAHQFIAESKSCLPYDVVILQNVLEHILNPEKLLIDLREILNQDGLILVCVPNDFSPLQLKAQNLGYIDEPFWFTPPAHINYFNVDRASTFAHASGYEIVDLFSLFPIDFFLFHPESNYISHPARGKMAHQARLDLEILLSSEGLINYLAFCRGLSQVKAGRNFCMLLKPRKK